MGKKIAAFLLTAAMVLALLPMKLPKEIELDNTLEAMQNFV